MLVGSYALRHDSSELFNCRALYLSGSDRDVSDTGNDQSPLASPAFDLDLSILIDISNDFPASGAPYRIIFVFSL